MKEIDVEIEPLKPQDIDKAKSLVKTVIEDSFQGEGLDLNTFKNEVEGEISSVQSKFDQIHSGNYHLLVAKLGNEIVGTVGYGTLGKPVQEALAKLDHTPSLLVEVMSLYINPAYQGKGIGSQLFKAVLDQLIKEGYKYYCLSTGYQKGKSFWGKKLGEPDVVLDRYYGDTDCWVWLKEIKDGK